jgi:hypothetical protein
MKRWKDKLSPSPQTPVVWYEIQSYSKSKILEKSKTMNTQLPKVLDFRQHICDFHLSRLAPPAE